MLSKEEYKENLTRMFDNLRDSNKGAKNCGGVDCHDCPLFNKICNCDSPIYYAHEAADVVEEWAKQHPIETNADKFRELFGVQPPINVCVNKMGCGNCEYCSDGRCNVRNSFWNSPYEEKRK